MLLGALFQYLWSDSWAPVMDEFVAQALWIIAPLVSLTIFVFLWGVWQAPAAIERDLHKKTMKELEDARESIAEYKRLVQEDNPIRTDPKTGATIIGRRSGPLRISGGVFKDRVILGGSD